MSTGDSAIVIASGGTLVVAKHIIRKDETAGRRSIRESTSAALETGVMSERDILRAVAAASRRIDEIDHLAALGICAVRRRGQLKRWIDVLHPVRIDVQQKIVANRYVFERPARIGIVGPEHVKAVNGILDQIIFEGYVLNGRPA